MSRPRNVNVQPCGTEAAYLRHLRHGEPPCPEDRQAHAQRELERQRARGVKPRGTPQHGTYTMYATYGCRCRACREAKTDYKADYEAGIRRRRLPSVPLAELVLDVLETWDRSMSTDELIGQVERIRPEAKPESVRAAIVRLHKSERLVMKESWDGVVRWWIT